MRSAQRPVQEWGEVANELFIARRYLRSSRRTGFISLISYMAVGGVVLGVAALVIILSVTNGFSGEVKNRLIGMNYHVMVTTYGKALPDYRDALQQVMSHDEVVAAAPVISSKGVIMSKRDMRVDGIELLGIEPESFASVSELPRHLLYDPDARILLGPLPEEEHNGIILGQELADVLKVGPGFEVLLLTVDNVDPEQVVLDGGFTPRFWPFLVSDAFSSGMYQFDRSLAFVALEDAQQVLGLGDAATHLHLRLRDIYQAGEVQKALQEKLGYPYVVRDWTQIFPEFFRWIRLEKWAIFIALSLIILVAAFNIMSILAMSVVIKTRDVGILRAMGCTASSIRRIFMLQGLIIGLVGTVLGCVLGYAVCLMQQHFHVISIPGDVYLINSLPVDMEITDFLLVSAVSLIICLLTSVYPARKAAALMPVDAIRYTM